jgi:hypothetical protein
MAQQIAKGNPLSLFLDIKVYCGDHIINLMPIRIAGDHPRRKYAAVPSRGTGPGWSLDAPSLDTHLPAGRSE